MDLRRLRLLAELNRLGSMREVAEELAVTTSTVSQQLAVLAREVGTPLLEAEGRRVRLTPAGRRLAAHADTILAAVDAARLDLDPGAEPAGTVRVSGFATAVRRSLLPIITDLCLHHPDVRLQVLEHEPAEAYALLADDAVDLALTYDYTLAPAALPDSLQARPLWSAPWALGVRAAGGVDGGSAPEVFARLRDEPWIVNSRNVADEQVVRTIASMAGFEPQITHHVDSLALVQDLIAAGRGIGLLPGDQPVREGVALQPLRDPAVVLRSYAVTRRGREDWAPLALILRMLVDGAFDRGPGDRA
ncbi:LysR family transcriptional regulator [Spongisporangium articulatum]|uniref:LysR family transcriptional regulator n=1 Tax=Spongisporangium articulatum TaxID=3362603 RepID=A0ABW8AJ14_9ACTN